MSIESLEIPLVTGDGHQSRLLARVPAQAQAALLWLPALGVAAKHYLPFAEELAAHGVAVFAHEWRGNGSSSLRPDRTHDWGYRELLGVDLPASHAAMTRYAASLPLLVGGHSLGGQLATCYAALHPAAFAQLWLVASGTPYWRSFPAPQRWALPLFYRFLPWLAGRRGRLNGRRLGFGGIEARGLIRDWAKVGLSNRYAAAGMDADLEAALAQLAIPVHGVLFDQDWLAPQGSLQALLARLAPAPRGLATLDDRLLGTRADHFAWMRQPRTVAASLLSRIRQAS